MLKNQIRCISCHRNLIIPYIPISQAQLDNCFFKCLHCDRKYSSTTNSIFYKKKLSICKFDCLVKSFLLKLSFEQTSYLTSSTTFFTFIKSIKVGKKTVKLYFSRFRTIISDFTELMMLQNPLRGTIEIDEAVITAKRRGVGGRFPRRLFWIFGMLSREQQKSYVFLVQDRRTDTIFRIIENFIQPGSLIISDQFSVYVTRNGNSRITQNLQHMNLTHVWVNHSITFVNPLSSSIHTNSIENFWSCLRKWIKRNLPLRNLRQWINWFLFMKFIRKEERYGILLSMISIYPNFN